MLAHSIARILACIVFISGGNALAQLSTDPPLIARPDENKHVNKQVPDVLLHLRGEETRRLSQFWSEKSIFLTFVFSRCAGICSPFLHSVKSVSDSTLGPTDDYQFIVISFDPRDTPYDMHNMAVANGVEDRPEWIFGTVSSEEIDLLTSEFDFQVQWDESRQQYNHPATLIAIDNGRYVRALSGGTVSSGRFKEVIAELRGEFVPIYPLQTNVLFRCFDYSPDKGFSPNWGLYLMLLPAMLAISGTLVIFGLTQRKSMSTNSFVHHPRD
jgi:protein SCO1/2